MNALSKASVAERLDCSVPTLDRIREEDPSFPLPFTLRGDRANEKLYWRDDEVDAWIAARPRVPRESKAG